MAEDRITQSKGDGPRMILYGVGRMRDMLAKGLAWYPRNYEVYFGAIEVVYLVGHEPAPLTRGATTLVSLGGHSGGVIDLLLAPLRLYRHCRRVRPTFYITPDQWFLWWTGFLVRCLLGAKIVLMPVSMPDQLFADAGQTATGLPRWLDKILIWLSYKACYRVYTGEAFGDFVHWLRANPLSKDKLVVTRKVADALPSFEFQTAVDALPASRPRREPMRLIYVGRLYAEKLVDHLIRVMSLVSRQGFGEKVKLIIIGDGAERENLTRLAQELGVSDAVEFRGAVAHDDLPQELSASDAFVSPLTGSSLREAALCRLPVIAYDRDWVHGLLTDGETALLVPPNDLQKFADAIIRLYDDPKLGERLSEKVHALARDLWSTDSLAISLQQLYTEANSADRIEPSRRASAAHDAHS